MKKIILLLGIFSNIFISFAQSDSLETKVTIGQKTDDKWRTRKNVFDHDEYGYYTIDEYLAKSKSKIVLEKYDESMNLINSSEFDLIYNLKKRQYLDIITINNVCYFFSIYSNKSHKKKYLFCQTINKKSLLLNNDLRKIDEIGHYGLFSDLDFNIKVSSDSTKLLVYAADGELHKFKISVLDNEMKLIWDKEIPATPQKKYSQIRDINVNNNGDVFAFIDNTRKNINNEYEYIYCTNNGSNIKRKSLDFSDHLLTGIKILFTKENNVISNGLFKKKDEVLVSGYYFLLIDGLSNEIIIEEWNKFDKNILMESWSEEYKQRIKKNETKLQRDEIERNSDKNQYSIDHLYFNTNGELILIAENRYIKNNSESSLLLEFVHGDVIVINLSNKGVLNSLTAIPKSQYVISGIDARMGSYFMLTVDNVIHLMYVDSYKSSEIKDGLGLQYTTKDKCIVMVTLDSTGKLSKRVVYKPEKDYKYNFIRMQDAKSVVKDEVIIQLQRRKVHQLLRIEFSDGNLEIPKIKVN